VRSSRYQPGDGHPDYPSVTGVSVPYSNGALRVRGRTLAW
jgi:hypothetical protein